MWRKKNPERIAVTKAPRTGRRWRFERLEVDSVLETQRDSDAPERRWGWDGQCLGHCIKDTYVPTIHTERSLAKTYPREPCLVLYPGLFRTGERGKRHLVIYLHYQVNLSITENGTPCT